MILDKYGQSIKIDDTDYIIGMEIVGTPEAEYGGLTGYITEIRTEGDMDTENEGPDIYCNFYPPDSQDAIIKLEEIFTELYDEPKTIDNIYLDCVIMASDMIEPVR